MRSFGLRSTRAMSALLVVMAGMASGIAHADTPAQSVENAQQLLEAGRLVEAKSILLTLRKQDANNERVLDLLVVTDRRLRFMDEVELSLQKAELAVKIGELRMAETHAAAARRSDKATDVQRERADAVTAEAAELRSELAPMAAPTLAQALSDFNNNRYSEAKAGLASILRTGVELSQEQMTEVNRYQDRIYELERQQGHSFEVEYVPLSVMQTAGKGVVAVASSLPAAAQTDQGTSDTSGSSSSQPQPGDSLMDETLRVDAERLLVEAEAAFQAGRYSEAIDKYNRAAGVYSSQLSQEQRTLAADRVAEARSLMGAPGVGTVDTVVQQRQIMREEAQAVYNNLIGQSRDALTRGDVQSARNLAAQARLTWNNAQANGLFSDEQYRQGIQSADALLREIDTAAESITRTEIETRQSRLKAEETRTRSQQEQERQQRINENLDRLRALQIEQKYEEALQVVDQVLFLDPTNPAALLLKDILKDVVLYRDFEKTRRQRGLSYAKERGEIEKSLIVPEDIMSYPADWPELSFRRGEVQSFVESDADRKVLATLESRRIPASFRDNTIEDVISFLATVTNLNFDVDWDSLAQIGIERDKQITLELREVPARVVLNRVLEKAQPDSFSKAGWAVNDGVLVIAADEALRKNTFIVIYDIRDLLFQIPDFPSAPELDLDQVLNQGGQGGGGGGGSVFGETGETAPIGPTEDELRDRILEIIQTNVDFEGWRDNGGDTGIVQELNGNLIITNTAKNHRQIQGLLNQLREIRAVQINVESRFLTVAADFFEQIAFDLDIYFNADNEQFSAVNRQLAGSGIGTRSGEGNSVLPSDLIGQRAGSTLGWVFTGIDPATGEAQYAFEQAPYSVPSPNNLSVIPVQSGSADITTGLALLSGNQLANTILTGNPALGIAGTFLDDVQVDFLIEATQADRRTVSLSAPRLTFSNGRAANIAVVNQIGFISDLQVVTGTGATGFDPTVGRLNSGFTLAVRGVASADRRYVTMTVQTAVSGRPSFRQQTLTAVAGGTGDNALPPAVAVGTIEIPTIDVTQVSTGVTVPDKGTVLLGGQRLSNEIEIETGVPILSKMPLINRFFTNRADIREDRTLLILMKPTIIIQNEEEEIAYPGLLDKLRDPYR